MFKKRQWQTIGEVCVDSGHLIICDPCQGEEASHRWIDSDLDLNKISEKWHPNMGTNKRR